MAWVGNRGNGALAGLIFLASASLVIAADLPGVGTPGAVRSGPASIVPAAAAAKAPATRHLDAAGRPTFTNALIRERSPYLLDYAHSPIAWQPWGEAAWAEARSRGRLVFVSIGYSSCHWCHVMARESFDDLGIAQVLNRGFISIKIDSEELPDVDRRFLARLEALGGAPGWPMNFVLTPDDAAIWGAGYLGRDELLATLQGFESRWKEDRKAMRQRAAAHESRFRSLALPPAAVPDVAEAYHQAVQRIAGEFDPLHKGFGTERKFPAPAELGVLRDAFLRSADGGHARKIVETLHAIASRGLYDRLDGGVFRYSIARSWNQPHFEKMLYDQAQVARLMCQGAAIGGDPVLANAATGIIDFVLARMSTASGLFASSFDSESAGVEGRYYLWTFADEDRLAAPMQRLLAQHFRGVMQSNGETLLVPLDPGAAPVPEALLAALREVRRSNAAPRRDDKAISAWNANMVAALAECSVILGRPAYAVEASTRMRRLLATNVEGGEIRRYSLAGQAPRAGTIDDLAWMLAALTALHDADGNERWMAVARRLLQRNLPARDDALQVALDLFASDRSVLSASAVLLRSLSQLARRSDEAGLRTARDRVARALQKFGGAAGHDSLTAALHELEAPAPSPVVFAAQGRIRLSVAALPAAGGDARFEVTADIRQGWHINSDRPSQDYLRPTRISVAGEADARVSYPPGKPLRFGSTGDVLSVLDGAARFVVSVPARRLVGDFPSARIGVALQTCSDRVCLPPETLQLAALAGATR